MAKTKEKVAEKKDDKKEGVSLTVAQLNAAPTSVEVVVDGQKLLGEKKEFKTGSVGWNCNGKVVIGGLKAQVSINIIIVKSKGVKK